MDDFLPDLLESTKDSAVSELTQIGRRLVVAMGRKVVHAMESIWQARRQSTPDEELANEMEEKPLLTIEQDILEQQIGNLLSVIEKLKVDVEENPRDQDAPEIPEEELDPDWFNSWRQGASNVSNDEIRTWWAKLLRGQVSQPGQFSLRTLALLHQMSSEDARLVEKAAAYVLNDGIVVILPVDEKWQISRPSYSLDLPKSDLHELIEIGFFAERTEDLILSLPDSLAGKTHKLVVGQNPNIRVTGGPPPNILTFRPLTRMGRELCQLVSTETNTEYLQWLVSIYGRSRAWSCVIAEREAVVVMNGDRL